VCDDSRKKKEGENTTRVTKRKNLQTHAFPFSYPSASKKFQINIKYQKEEEEEEKQPINFKFLLLFFFSSFYFCILLFSFVWLQKRVVTLKEKFFNY
jgi:hypothetical protein